MGHQNNNISKQLIVILFFILPLSSQASFISNCRDWFANKANKLSKKTDTEQSLEEIPEINLSEEKAFSEIPQLLRRSKTKETADEELVTQTFKSHWLIKADAIKKIKKWFTDENTEDVEIRIQTHLLPQTKENAHILDNYQAYVTNVTTRWFTQEEILRYLYSTVTERHKVQFHFKYQISPQTTTQFSEELFLKEVLATIEGRLLIIDRTLIDLNIPKSIFSKDIENDIIKTIFPKQAQSAQVIKLNQVPSEEKNQHTANDTDALAHTLFSKDDNDSTSVDFNQAQQKEKARQDLQLNIDFNQFQNINTIVHELIEEKAKLADLAVNVMPLLKASNFS